VAKICTVIATSHSPFLFEPLDWWNRTRAGRSYAPGATVDDDAENERKFGRVVQGLATLRDVFQSARPDVVLAFGDDQEEQFDLMNHPSFAVYVGGRFEGYKAVRYAGKLGSRPFKPKTAEHWAGIDAKPDLAKAVLYGLMKAGFDPAFMLELPNQEIGMGHAFMRPMGPLTDGRFDVPMVPILVNCLYAPQPRAVRCVALARAVRKIIAEDWPRELRVAVLGSGGLWHTPGAPESYLDEEFDREILARLKAGDADAMASYFDGWSPNAERKELRCFEQFPGGTGMAGGVGSGSGETRNWIMAAAIADRPGQVIDYIPVHASPCGVGFAYWNMDG
jgi:Catalytic LigB subunit of aromatic ring-opening dioxygenase